MRSLHNDDLYSRRRPLTRLTTSASSSKKALAPSSPSRAVAEGVALVYRFLMLAVIVLGLGLECVEWKRPLPALRLWKFTFYTIQSNLVLAVYTAHQLGKRLSARSRPADESRHFIKSALMMMISITGIVWHAILTSKIDINKMTPRARLATQILHTVTPLLFWLDWALFDIKGVMEKKFLPGYLVPPLYYLAFSILRAQIMQTPLYHDHNGIPRYHWYGFIDPNGPLRLFPSPSFDHKPIAVVAINCSIIATAILLLGILFITLDRLLAAALRSTRTK